MFRGFWPGGNKVSHIYSTLHRVVIMAQSYHSLGCYKATLEIWGLYLKAPWN